MVKHSQLKLKTVCNLPYHALPRRLFCLIQPIPFSFLLFYFSTSVVCIFASINLHDYALIMVDSIQINTNILHSGSQISLPKNAIAASPCTM